MTFDNKRTSYKIYLRKLFLAITFTLLTIIILFSGWFEGGMLGLSKYYLVLAIAFIYILIILINLVRNMNYFYFNDNGQNIIIRYYPLRPLSKSRKSVEIPKTTFAGFEIRGRLLGLRKELIVKQLLKKTVASYPPISISSLTGEELRKLTGQLVSYRK